MAAIDSLLRMISARNAQALTIESESVPLLDRKGTRTPMSMPPLSAQMVAGFLDEVGGHGTTSYRAEDGSAYLVSVEARGEGVRMKFAPQSRESSQGVAVKSVSREREAEPRLTVVEASSSQVMVQALERARLEGASDILFSSGKVPRLRIEGRLTAFGQDCVSESEIVEVLGIDCEALESAGSLDFAWEGNCRYRVNAFSHVAGLSAVLRPIRQVIPSLTELNLPSSLTQLIDYRDGLVLLAGPTGTGKSSTLAALIEHINQTREAHVVTLEDPIEFRYESRRALVHQRELGSHLPDFASGLRAALRKILMSFSSVKCATARRSRQRLLRRKPGTWYSRPFTRAVHSRPSIASSIPIRETSSSRFAPSCRRLCARL